MFRRSTVIFAASLALLSTLDSATCFAAAAPALPREDLDRPRFLKKEIKRFVFSNTTTSRGGTPDEASTSDLEALHDTLTSLSLQDLGPDATPNSATSATTTTQSATPSDNGQTSTSDVSSLLAGDSDKDREALLALHPSTTNSLVSSTPPPSSSPFTSEETTTQSSVVPESGLDTVTGSSQFPPLTSATSTDQLNVPQTTHSSAVQQPENSVTSAQLGSTVQAETSAIPSSTAIPNNAENIQDALDIAHQTSSGIVAEASISSSGEYGSITSPSQTTSSPPQQTDNQVMAEQTQGSKAPQSSLSSESAGTQPTTTSIAGSTSLVLPGGEKVVSSPSHEADHSSAAVTTAAGSLESLPATSVGAGSLVVIPQAGTTAKSSANDEIDHLTPGGTIAEAGTPLFSTAASVSLLAAPGDALQTSTKDTDNQSLGGEATSGVSAPNTETVSEGLANTKSIPYDVVPTTSGSEAGGITSHTAEPASSPVAPQSVAIPATGTSQGSEASHTTAGAEGTQPTMTPGSGSGSTSQNGGSLGSSASVVLVLNPIKTSSPAGASPPQTTLADGAVVPNTAQFTGAVTDTTTPLETPLASLSSPSEGQTSSPHLNLGASEPASVANPSVAAAASKLNTIPASVENPLATVSGNPPSIFNPALTAAASVVDSLPASVQNPEHQISPAGSPNSASLVISNSPAGATGSPVTTGSGATASPVEGAKSPGVTGSPVSGTAIGGTNSPVEVTGSPVSGTAIGATNLPAPATGSPVSGTAIAATNSPVGATGSPVSGTAVGVTDSPVGVTGSPVSGTAVGVTDSPIGATASPVSGTAIGATDLPAGATASPVSGTAIGATDLPAPATGSPIGGTASQVAATGSPVGATGSPEGGSASLVGGTQSLLGATANPLTGTESPVGVTASPVATGSSGEHTAGQVSGQNPQITATGGVVPESGRATASNAEVIPGTQAPNSQSATPESGIAGYSTQSNGKVVPISAAAGTGSAVSNGQIVPAPTGNEASAQSPGPSETGAVAASIAAQSAAAVATQNYAASNAAQSAAAVAAAATQNNAASPGQTATPAVRPPQEFFGKGPYTQSPVGYDTSTTQIVPTSIIHGPSSTPSATQGHYFGPSNLPSNVPQILYQNGGPGSQPSNTRLINIAFRYPLNYLFVYNHTVSQQQIFHYIPLGISYGLEIEVSQITMQSLRAWDTFEDVGYVTTLALAWIPEGLVDNLGLLVSTPVSRLYYNPDNSTAFLLSMINTAIPITGSNSTDGGSTPFGNIPSDTTSAKTAGAPIGGDIGSSEHVRASSVGIGVGVACGAAAYGAAMFFVARRYKKRRQSHLRSPSMFSSPVMSHAGPDAGAGAALMSGAMGERSASPYYDNDGRAGSRGSGRSGSSRHQISAPVMAENSLGWN